MRVAERAPLDQYSSEEVSGTVPCCCPSTVVQNIPSGLPEAGDYGFMRTLCHGRRQMRWRTLTAQPAAEDTTMGVLDQLGGALGGALGQGKNAGVSAVLLQQLIAMLSKPGALANLTSAFQGAGLGNVLQSWVGTGQNLPISADQVTKVLGSGTIADLAKKAGIGESETSSALAGLLPQVIDKVTPGGNVPAQNDLGGALASLGKLLG
jgi:uncharacterized protein YidB (DUF937 family)